MQTRDNYLRQLFFGALGCFILAGSTGALFRFGMAYGGLPFGLDFGNVRHAHSHTMYFGWVTPALMALIAAQLPSLTGRVVSPKFKWAIGGTIVLALLAYTPFLLYGYNPAVINGQTVPLSVIGASLNALGWYAFAVLYFFGTRGVRRNLPLRLWDAALAFLVIASLGAMARGILVALKVTDPFLTDAAVHLFLDLFSDGWFVLGLLGVAFALVPAAERAVSRWSYTLLVVGLPFTFLLGPSVAQVPIALRLIAGLGGILVGIGLLDNVRALWSATSRAWKLPLFFLALKAVAELGLSVPPIAAWGENAGLRIPYLHVLFLGFATLAILAAVEEIWGREFSAARIGMSVAVCALLVSLVPLTSLFPRERGGEWTLLAAAFGALAPVAIAIAILVAGLGRRPPAPAHPIGTRIHADSS